MFKKLTKDNKLAKGFTIIEVMIVLAIAGLIMVVVLIAVPQLQRSQRNTATRSVADRVFTELQNFASNNNGKYPTTGTEQTAFCLNYLQRQSTATTGQCTSNAPGVTGAAFLNDPRTGTPVSINFVTAATSATDATVPGDPRTINVHVSSSATGTGFKCNGEQITTANGGRQVALNLWLEGGAQVCRDNQ